VIADPYNHAKMVFIFLRVPLPNFVPPLTGRSLVVHHGLHLFRAFRLTHPLGTILELFDPRRGVASARG